MPTELGNKLAELKKAKAASGKAKVALDEAEKFVESVREEISGLVSAGHTSGDPLTDYILRCKGDLDGERYRHSRAINKLLAGKTGEVVMLLYSERARRRLHDPSESLEARVAFGVLRGDKLTFSGGRDGGSPTLPTDSFILGNLYGKVHFEKKPLSERSFPLNGRFEPFVKKDRKKYSLQEYRCYILPGTKEVRDFLENSFDYHVRRYEIFGRDVDPEELFRQVGYLELVSE